MVQPLNGLDSAKAPQAGADPQQPIPKRPARARSRAWIYYSILAVVFVIAAFTQGAGMLLPAIGFGVYARYLYRGGRIVIWFW